MATLKRQGTQEAASSQQVAGTARLVGRSFSQERLSMGLQTIKLQMVGSREPIIWESMDNLLVQ